MFPLTQAQTGHRPLTVQVLKVPQCAILLTCCDRKTSLLTFWVPHISSHTSTHRLFTSHCTCCGSATTVCAARVTCWCGSWKYIEDITFLYQHKWYKLDSLTIFAEPASVWGLVFSDGPNMTTPGPCTDTKTTTRVHNIWNSGKIL